MANDLISRQAAIDAIDVLKRNYPSNCFEELCNAVDIAIKALSAQTNLQPTCNQLATDCISRQAAIDTLSFFKERLNHHLGETDFREEDRAWGLNLIQHCIDFVREMASAQPEIIKCKDCRWYEGDIMANPWGICCNAGWVGGHCGHEVSEDGWCYRAEVEE